MKKTSIALIALLMLAPTLASAGEWTGWITDDHCGAKGAKAEHKNCAEKCLENGGKLVFYNPADEKVYNLDKQDVAKEHLGHEVKVTGSVEGDSIKVEKIEMAQAQEGHAHH
ncbi:MAG TPA: DUF5818 domain-containing protein [Thermoanaerobaculia bacterium]